MQLADEGRCTCFEKSLLGCDERTRVVGPERGISRFTRVTIQTARHIDRDPALQMRHSSFGSRLLTEHEVRPGLRFQEGYLPATRRTRIDLTLRHPTAKTAGRYEHRSVGAKRTLLWHLPQGPLTRNRAPLLHRDGVGEGAEPKQTHHQRLFPLAHAMTTLPQTPS